MKILPLRGIGTLVHGDAPSWLDVRIDDALVTATRLPDASIVIPLRTGIASVQQGGRSLLDVPIDADLVPRPDGFVLKAPGARIHAWPFDPSDPQAGWGTGGKPAASGDGVLDLEALKLPHDFLHIVVQARREDRIGPACWFLYRPSPRPARLVIDHDHGPLGPRVHLDVDTADVGRLALRVERHVRQTDRDTHTTYQVEPGAERITLDDLLHGDALHVLAAPPHALQGTDGPVASLHFRYRAVPEPRLEAVQDGDALGFEPGLLPLEADEVAAMLEPWLGRAVAGPDWHEEWDWIDDADDLPSAVAAVVADAEDPVWWARALQAGQDVDAARTVRGLMRVDPESVDEASRALRTLDGFPVQVFKELADARAQQGLVADIQDVQGSLGIRPLDGAATIALAAQVREALDVAVERWAGRLEQAGLAWLDGALEPLHESDDLDALSRLLRTDPLAGIDELRARRRRVWRHAHTAQVDEGAPDVAARRTLLDWHLLSASDALADLRGAIEAIGVPCRQTTITDVARLAQAALAVTEAAEIAVDRVQEVPLSGPRFIQEGVAEGQELRRRMEAAWAPWTRDGVPRAVATPAARLLDCIDADAAARLAVWSRFIRETDAWIRDMDTMAHADGDAGRQAKRVRDLFREAKERRDPRLLAEAADDFRDLESSIEDARDAWFETIRDAAPTTRRALGLSREGELSWEAIHRRMGLDAAEIRGLARLLARVDAQGVKLEMILANRGDLQQVVDAAAGAEQDRDRADAVRAYDALRRRIAGWWDEEDAVEALRLAYLAAVADHARHAVQGHLRRADPERLAALRAFPDVPGTRELVVLVGFLEAPGLEPTPEAVDHATKVAAVVDRLRGLDEDPWTVVAETLRQRLRNAFPDLVRYLGDSAPRWDDIEVPERALGWIHNMVAGLRTPQDHPEVAALLPGTRRLVQHTLKEHGLWLRATP